MFSVVVTSLMTSLFVTSLMTSLLWRHYRLHGWRHYCDVTTVQHASHTHPHVNITVEISDTWANFLHRFNFGGMVISLYLAGQMPNPQNVIRVRFTQTNRHRHTMWSQYLSLAQSPMHHALKEKKRIPIVSHHCHVVQNPATTVTRTDIPDRCTSSHAATHKAHQSSESCLLH